MINVETGVVLGLIYNDEGQLLIARRDQPDDPENHEKWELVGGQVEFEEIPEQAMVREAKEESGYDVEVKSLVPKAYTYTRVLGDRAIKMYFFAFICRIVGGQETLSDEEIGELRFIEPKEIINYECLPIVQEAVLLAETLKL